MRSWKLELVRRPWTEEDFTYHGHHHAIAEQVTVYPRPVQQPHPPVYVACFSEPTMRVAAEMGFIIVAAPFAATMMFRRLQAAVARFKEYARDAGHPDVTAMCSYFTVLADTPEEQRAGRERLPIYLRGISPAFPSDRDKRRRTSATSPTSWTGSWRCSPMILVNEVS